MENNPEFLINFIREDLYLIREADTEAKEPDNSEKQEDRSPGRQKISGLIILVDYPDGAEISGSSEQLLEKIMNAVNVSLSDTQIINLDDYGNLEHITDAFHFEKCKIIGFLPDFPALCRAFFPEEKYSVSVTGSNEFLLVDSLEEIENNIGYKQRLWTQLKKLFALN